MLYLGLLSSLTTVLLAVSPAANQSSSAEPELKPSLTAACEIVGTAAKANEWAIVKLSNNTNRVLKQPVITFRRGGEEKEKRTLSDLAPGQAAAETFFVTDWANESNATISYFDNGVQNVVVASKPPTSAAASTSSSLSQILIPAIISAAALLLGALASHLSSIHREDKQEQRQRRRLLFDKQYEAMSAFVASWSMSHVTQVLDSSFAELRSKIAVPGHVEDAYRSLRKTLASQHSSQSEKDEAVKRLRGEIDKALTIEVVTGQVREDVIVHVG